MGNTRFTKETSICVKPLGSRLGVIQKLKDPTTAKQYKSFVGMVNFVSYILPRVTKNC